MPHRSNFIFQQFVMEHRCDYKECKNQQEGWDTSLIREIIFRYALFTLRKIFSDLHFKNVLGQS